VVGSAVAWGFFATLGRELGRELRCPWRRTPRRKRSLEVRSGQARTRTPLDRRRLIVGGFRFLRLELWFLVMAAADGVGCDGP